MIYINDITFFVIFSRDNRLITDKFLPSCNAVMLNITITKVIYIHNIGGSFVVYLVLMDIEFECIEIDSWKNGVNSTAAREHLGEIKCQVKVIEE